MKTYQFMEALLLTMMAIILIGGGPLVAQHIAASENSELQKSVIVLHPQNSQRSLIFVVPESDDLEKRLQAARVLDQLCSRYQFQLLVSSKTICKNIANIQKLKFSECKRYLSLTYVVQKHFNLAEYAFSLFSIPRHKTLNQFSPVNSKYAYVLAVLTTSDIEKVKKVLAPYNHSNGKNDAYVPKAVTSNQNKVKKSSYRKLPIKLLLVALTALLCLVLLFSSLPRKGSP